MEYLDQLWRWMVCRRIVASFDASVGSTRRRSSAGRALGGSVFSSHSVQPLSGCRPQGTRVAEYRTSLDAPALRQAVAMRLLPRATMPVTVSFQGAAC